MLILHSHWLGWLTRLFFTFGMITALNSDKILTKTGFSKLLLETITRRVIKS